MKRTILMLSISILVLCGCCRDAVLHRVESPKGEAVAIISTDNCLLADPSETRLSLQTNQSTSDAVLVVKGVHILEALWLTDKRLLVMVPKGVEVVSGPSSWQGFEVVVE